MKLDAGTRLGPYEILALIGAGGMGEVYKARDTRLDRVVAVKICAEQFNERFEREARAVAALNHPNICALYDVGPNYLVMEYIEGPTLGGPFPLAEALAIARQIAEALEAAHEKGIIHRDLKPANIKLTADGKVKVLDFGLAKAFDNEAPNPSSDPANSPTLTMRATQAGMIMGTPGYMSPEQASGQHVDKRADIWAYGVVLWEMLCGKTLFSGETLAHTLAAVLTLDPAWDRLPADTPASIRKLLRRCLERDRKKRLRDIGDALVEIDEAPEAATAAPQTGGGSRWWIAAVVLTALVALALAAVHFREAPPPEPATVRFQIPMPEKTRFERYFAISPDGRRLAFRATGPDGRILLWVRALDSLEARPFPGTDNANLLFWSPDSRFIGYYADGKLKKVEASGGPPQTLCDTPVATGAWNRDGVILFGNLPSGGLSRVSAAGGVPKSLTKPDSTRQETNQAWPVFLPDGKHFLYFAPSSDPEGGAIYIAELDSKLEVKGQKRLTGSQYAPAYAPTADSEKGYLLFLREATLMAQAFDAKGLELAGEAFPAAEQVGAERRVGFFGVSANRTLVYRTGGGTGLQLEWFDREGKSLGVAGPVSTYGGPVLSPDGKQVAVERTDAGRNQDIWLLDQARGTSQRFTFDPLTEANPVWSPDGGWVAFASTRDGPTNNIYNIYRKRASNEGAEEALLKSGIDKRPTDWSRDGRFLLYTAIDPKTGRDLWVLPLDGDRTPRPYLQAPFDQAQGQFSPDGRWVAYTSSEFGQPQVYVQPFPASGGKWQISTAGGGQPRWRGDGKELFYIGLDRKLMAVEVKTGAKFEPGIPRALFNTRMLSAGITVVRYAAAADGKRFLIANGGEDDSSSAPFNVVLNWKPGRP